MRARLCRYVAAIAIVCSCLWTSNASAGSALEQSTDRQLSKAIYTIPPFAVKLQSAAALAPEDDEVVVAYTLRSPLELITSEFLLESVRIDISKNRETSDLMEFVRRQFLTINLVVTSLDMTVVESTGKLSVAAEFQGTAAFALSEKYKPTNSEVWNVLGDWIERAFGEDFGVFERYLLESTNSILRQHTQLIVETDIEPGNPTPSSGGMSGERVVMIVAIVLVAVATVMASVFLVRPYIRSKVDVTSSTAPHHNNSVLPGRRDMDAIEAANDSYLARHRPEIFAAVKRATPPGSDRSRDDPPVLTVIGRSPSRAEQKEGEVDPDSISGAQAANGFTPVSSWWNKLAMSLAEIPNGDGLVCEEDPSRYDFPFQDFPRPDGTPCLIYNDSVDLTTAASAGRASFYPETITVDLPQCKDTLTDDEFKEQLAATTAERSASLEETEEADAEDGEETDDVPFPEKLERLVAMRHRHFEQERILERARQRREADERELRLRRHEMELDLEQIEASLTPRALSRKKLDQASIVPDDARSHRATVSESDYDVVMDRLRSGATDQAVVFGADRTDDIGLPPPPPRVTLESLDEDDVEAPRIVTPQSVSNGSAGPKDSSRPSLGSTKHRRSHRRSFSHGTNLADEKKTGSDGADDVMTFGIAAAYKQFV